LPGFPLCVALFSLLHSSVFLFTLLCFLLCIIWLSFHFVLLSFSHYYFILGKRFFALLLSFLCCSAFMFMLLLMRKCWETI
jgi:hypothetical protein